MKGIKFDEIFLSLTILDCGLVSIGNNDLIGPNVNIIKGEYETGIEARKANRELEFAGPIVNT